jgi:hypothetical protein
MKPSTLLLSCGAVALMWSEPADACGCFAPPDPTVPVVQAGERILFAVKNGEVTAHVQVQYSGASGTDFGWLLPLPAVPTLELGTDELFTQLTTATQPRYRMTTTFDSSCQQGFGTGGGSSGFGAGGGASGGSSFGGVDAGVAGSPLVVHDSVGPYDYAVLRADSKQAMLDWLMANRYFVPSNSDAAIDPYVRPGAYFLALKLRPGNSTGDLQPVVLRYQSDVGQIPITLTSVGAVENMGVQVWLLGEGRGIPRNYHHTVINDALIDWPSSGQNYNDVIIRAVGEAPRKHSFVTEFAGSGAAVGTALSPPTRFGTRDQFERAPTPEAFIDLLWQNGFASRVAFGQGTFPGPLRAILARYLPPPAGLSTETFYGNYQAFKSQAPPQNYQPVAMTEEIWLRIVTPIREAGALFSQHRVLTRLYTTISPQDMNRDPVFAFNPALPMVSNVHQAGLRVACTRTPQGSVQVSQSVLTTEQGAQLVFTRGQPLRPDLSQRASRRIELLREEGEPEVLVDNSPSIDMGAAPGDRPVFLETPPQTLPLPRGAGCEAVPVGGLVGALLAVMVARRRRGGR